MTHELELLIVIINYKTADLVIDCLKTVLPQLQTNQSVVVVDNDSQDGSADVIAHWLSESGQGKIDLIRSPLNSGFSGGNNLGIKHKKAQNYLLLNSDTLLRENALSELLRTAAEFPDAGMVSPRLEWPDSTPQISCFRFHNPISEFIYAASTGPITKLLKRWDVPLDIESSLSFPEWTSFACVLVKAEVIDRVGLMDDGYFLYYEDVDYCRMAKNEGLNIVNNPSARVVHLRGGSSDVKKNISTKRRLPKYYYASRSRYFAKHYGVLGLVLTNLMWHSGRIISYIRERLGKQDSPACENQYADIWTNLSQPLKPFRIK